MNILKISYDGLEPYEKELFLDIACFWRRQSSSTAMEILEACGLHPEIGIKVLRQKALVTIIDTKYGVAFDMHDLVQEMGHNIVRGKYPKNPEKHSRVWKCKEIKEMCYGDAITENVKTEAIQHMFCRDNSLPLSKLVSNMKKLRWLFVSTEGQEGQEGPTYLSNELRYIYWDHYPASAFPDAFLPNKLVVLELNNSMQKELWTSDQELPHLKVLELNWMKKLISTPDFNRLPRLQTLKFFECIELEEIHPSLGNHTNLEYLSISDCEKLKKLPTISGMKKLKTLLIMWCYLKDGELPCGIGELSNLEKIDLTANGFSRLDFSLSQLTRLKSLDLSLCVNLLELPELPSSLAILTADTCHSLTIVGDLNKNCKQLCQVSLVDGWSYKLLQSMLKGKAIENGSMHLYLEGLKIPKGFIPPLLRGGTCKLKLAENWCYNFSGFLLCLVVSDDSYRVGTRMSMKQVSGTDFEDDVVWEESEGDTHTWVWYVSFGSLRHTTWWDQTYKSLEFKIKGSKRKRCSGFGVRLISKKSTSGPTETSTNSSSPYTPKFKIINDSASTLTADLIPYFDY